jgi:hypothetical protein
MQQIEARLAWRTAFVEVGGAYREAYLAKFKWWSEKHREMVMNSTGPDDDERARRYMPRIALAYKNYRDSELGPLQNTLAIIAIWFPWQMNLATHTLQTCIEKAAAAVDYKTGPVPLWKLPLNEFYE